MVLGIFKLCQFLFTPERLLVPKIRQIACVIVRA